MLIALGTGAEIKNVNAYFTPDPLPIKYWRYGDDKLNCHGHMVEDCLKGQLTSEIEVLVLGDSHAAMLNHFFDYLGKELGFKARLITASSCVTIPGFDYQRIAEWARKSCLSQMKEAERCSKVANTIFLAAYWNWHLNETEFKKAIVGFLDGNKDASIYLISQEPLLRYHPMRNYRFEHLGIERKASLDLDYLRANEWLERQSASRLNVDYLALNNLPMFNEAPVLDGEITYYDEHHLNEVGVLEYAKESLPLIKKNHI